MPHGTPSPNRRRLQVARGDAATPPPPGHRVPALCLATFLVIWGAFAIAPSYRMDWLLENLPTFLILPVFVLSYRRFRFSNRAYVQGTIFLLLHTVGSHYTYSDVPVGEWMARTFDLGRNHYDRFVHLASGFLLLRPVRELAFRRVREPGPFATLALSVTAIGTTSVLYEIVEWLVAIAVDPSAGTAFLGTQGDVWDAQKDMALALGGAVLAALVEAEVDPPRPLVARPRAPR